MLLYILVRFLFTSEKITARESCRDFKCCIPFIDIRIANMNIKYDKLINGKNYILSRLRLAALCGLNNYKVSEIWSWISLVRGNNRFAFPLRTPVRETPYEPRKFNFSIYLIFLPIYILKKNLKKQRS